jgi:hypothetical protein
VNTVSSLWFPKYVWKFYSSSAPEASQEILSTVDLDSILDLVWSNELVQRVKCR